MIKNTSGYSLQDLKKRYACAYDLKQRWLSLYSGVYRYVVPNRNALNVLFNYQDDGQPNTLDIWDDTAVSCAYKRANDLHSLLMPMDRRWAKLALNPAKVNSDQREAAQPDLDAITEIAFYYINSSNLARVVSGSNLDLAVGTAAIWVESQSDDNPLVFRSIPGIALILEYTSDDIIENCWYLRKMTGYQIQEAFPNYNGSKRGRIDADPNEMQSVVYGQIKNPKTGRYFIYAVMDEDPDTLLFGSDRDYQQIIVYRDHVRPGESDGRGPGTDLLPTIIDLNRLVKDDRQSMAKKANPPVFYDASARTNPNSIRQWSGAMIAKGPGGSNPYEAMQFPEYPDVFERVQDLRQVIRDAFQVDPLGPIDETPKSATEISIRQNEAQRTSQTSMSRLINECPKIVFQTVLKILAGRGLLKNETAAYNLNVDSSKFLIEFVSPLSDIQDEQDLNNFNTRMQITQQYFGPEAAVASTNMGEVSEFLTSKLNLPSKLFKSGTQIQQLLDQMQQQQQQAAQQAAQQNGQTPQGVSTVPNLPTPTTAAITPQQQTQIPGVGV